jgi:multicomponent Na+:H+ antiporter subunit F
MTPLPAPPAGAVIAPDPTPADPGLLRLHDDGYLLGLPVYDIALVMIGLSMLLTLARLIRGPTLADRVVALDLLAFFAAGAIAVVAMGSDRAELLMVAVVVALLTFMSTAAFALYIERQGRETGEARARDAG